MERYSAYKESLVDWIGSIPSHWEIKKLKYLAKVQTGNTPPKDNEDNYDEQGSPWVKPNDLKEFAPITETQERLSSQGIQLARLVPKGSVLVCCIGSIGKLGIAGNQVCTNQQINSLIFNNLAHLDFAKYMVYASTEEHNQKADGNVVKILNSGKQKNIQYCIPPLPEQEAIASYLDRKTKQIDDLIAKKERLIELIKEERAAIINQAVTKGLDPDIPMKDSGIEWLGEIPENWKTTPLKAIIRELKSGVSVNSEDTPVAGDEIGILKTSCVYNYYFEPEENKKVLPEEHDRVACPVTQGCIIISRMNTPNLVGASGFTEKEYSNLYLPDRLWITEFFSHLQLDAKWLSYIFVSDSFRSELSSKATGTSPSMKNISKEDLLTIKVPYPDHVMQEEIRTFIDDYHTQTTKQVARYRKQIDLLKEYKTTLISEAVTGKIDIRNIER